LDFQGLMDLRSQVDEALTGYRSTLERQLAALGSSVASLGGKVARGMRGSKLKGMKVAPKYRSPGPLAVPLACAELSVLPLHQTAGDLTARAANC
jgi:hypothetical protein